MQGNTEQQQLILISQLCGSITTEVWPGVENLDLFNKMDLPKGQKRKVNNNGNACSEINSIHNFDIIFTIFLQRKIIVRKLHVTYVRCNKIR